DLVFVLGRARRTRSAAGPAGLFVGSFRRSLGLAADGRRQNVERDGLAAVDAGRFVVGLPLAITTVVAIVAARTIALGEALVALLAPGVRSLGVGFGHFFLAVVVVVGVVIIALPPRALILEATP